MTLNQLIALFKAMGDAHKFIKTTEFGEVPDKVEAETETTIYPAFYQVPTGSTTKDNTVERSFQLILCDLVYPDHSNLNEVLSDTEQYIQDIVRVLKDYADEYTLMNDPIATPFKDGFGDAVAGYYVEVVIETPNTSTLCNIPIIDFGYPGDPGTPGEYPSTFGCDDLVDCQVIQDIEIEIGDLDIRVTALEQGSGGGNFIPLSGTIPGSDITGPLNFANNLPNLLSSINGDNGSYLIGNGTQTQLINYDTATNNQAGLIITGTQYSLASIDTTSGIVAIMYNDNNGAFQFSSSNPNSGGLIGNQDFSINYDPLSFVQRTYVENNYVPISISTLTGITSTISNLGPRILSTVTDTINNNTTVIDHRSNRYTLSNNLSSGLSSGFVLNNGTVRLSSTNSNTADLNDLRLDALSFDVFSQASSGSYFNITGQNTGDLLFEVTGVNDTITIKINDNDALVGASDYSAFYSAFSFVQKIYVDNAIAGITPTPQTLAQILAIGNTTGANNLILETGQQIVSSTSTNNLDLNVGNDTVLFSEGIVKLISDNAYIELRGDYTDILKTANIKTESARNAELNFITNNGIARGQIYVKDSDQTFNLYTVNSDTIFYNGPGSNQYETLRLTYDNNVIINQENITFGTNYKLGKMFMGGSSRNYEALGIQNQNAGGYAGFLFGQDDNNIAIFVKGGTTAVGTFSGTSVPMANTTIFQSGSGYDQPIHFASGNITAQTNLNPSNYGYRLDSTGLRVGLNSTIHNSNTVPFQVDGAAAVTSIVANGTGGLGYVRIMGQSSAPAVPATVGGNIWFNASGNLAWNRKPQLGTDTFTRFFTGNITADRSYILPNVSGTVALTSNITTALTPYQNSNVVTASVNTNITTANGNYVFNGTTATFTLPALANNKTYTVANIGSGNLTINSGSVNIFDLSTGIPVNSIIITALSMVKIIDNGTYFIIG